MSLLQKKILPDSSPTRVHQSTENLLDEFNLYNINILDSKDFSSISKAKKSVNLVIEKQNQILKC